VPKILEESAEIERRNEQWRKTTAQSKSTEASIQKEDHLSSETGANSIFTVVVVDFLK
jgi:hypothetical protein